MTLISESCPVAQDYVGPLSPAEPDPRGQDLRSLGGHERREGRAAGASRLLSGEAVKEPRGGRVPEAREPGGQRAGSSARHQDLRLRHRSRRTSIWSMELFAAPNVKQIINQGGRGNCADCAKALSARRGEGLAYFHSQGWIHRDIKPDNFLMNARGEVKLIDFALARATKRAACAAVLAGRRKCRAPAATCRPSKSAASRSTSGPTSTASAAWSYESWRQAAVYRHSTNDLLNKHLRSPIPPVQAVNRNVTTRSPS